MKADTSEANLPEADESFWSEVLSADQNSSNETVSRDFDQSIGAAVDPQVNTAVQLVSMDYEFSGSNMYDNCMDFWYNVFTRAGEIPELLEIWYHDDDEQDWRRRRLFCNFVFIDVDQLGTWNLSCSCMS